MIPTFLANAPGIVTTKGVIRANLEPEQQGHIERIRPVASVPQPRTRLPSTSSFQPRKEEVRTPTPAPTPARCQLGLL